MASEYGIEIDTSRSRAQQILDALPHLDDDDLGNLIKDSKHNRDTFILIEARDEANARRRRATGVQPTWEYNDGGRADAGYKGHTGDCGCRAVAIAAELPYQEVYDRIIDLAKSERRTRRKQHISHPRTGVYRPTMKKLMAELGWEWIATMGIGTGCTIHLRPDELPDGRLILNLSKHYAAFVDGVLLDTSDCSREGTRCVYGYWKEP